MSQVLLARALWTIALLTLILDVATALYKPARGEIFGRNRRAYYITLAVIFAAGFAEALTAFWLSRYLANKRLLSVGRAALLVSMVPFVAIIAIGGFAFMEG
jgi:hypothetical protein